MKMKKLNQSGSHAVMAVVVIVVIAVVGLVGWRVATSHVKKNNDQHGATLPSSANGSSSGPVSWMRGADGWQVQGTPPACPSPLKFNSPANISQTTTTDIPLATAILYPGQYRGGNYKPHGGLRFSDNQNDLVTVKLPMDAKLYKGSRYIEQGETQYLLVFINPCGIMFKFDHLYTLSATYQKIVEDNFPPAKVDNSETTNLNKDIEAKAGDIIATGVGFKKTGNTTFDFGVYDLRNKNEISKNSAWAAKHTDDNEYAPYAICWLDFLSGSDSAKAKALPAGDGVSGSISDYCKTSAGNTLTNTVGNPSSASAGQSVNSSATAGGGSGTGAGSGSGGGTGGGNGSH